MKLEDLRSHVLPSDIPETYQPVVTLIGVDALIELCLYCRGDMIYFPKADTIFKKTRNRMIRQEYDGYNLRELSRRYDLTIRQIKNIVRCPEI